METQPLLQLRVIPVEVKEPAETWLLGQASAEMILGALEIVEPDSDDRCDMRDDLQTMFERITHLLGKGGK